MNKQKADIKLGSLFDGIGGFPYAGSFFGIKPLWASEIMPQAVSVTMKHLPVMEHVGDITKLNGGELPPVDIITFGSPCQDLSTAGKRAGIGGERSSLFYEAIRIIDEMREATNGKYPRYAIWENVPGALSSGKPRGSDYKAVLEAFTKTEIPIPESGGWANAGMVRGNGIDLAWCVYNAQYFGVPQRRRRIFLVCDFSGGSSGEILFVAKSLSGYFAASRAQRQGTAADAVRGSDGASISANVNDTAATLFAEYGNHWNGNAGAYDGGNFALSQNHNCLNPWDTQQLRVFTEDGTSPTLAGADGCGGRNLGGLVCATFLGGAGEKARSIGYSEKVSPTLKSGACGFNAPCLCEPKFCAVINDQGGDSLSVEKQDISPTLRSETHGNLPIVSLCEAYPINTQTATRHKTLGEGTGFGIAENGAPAYTLQETHSHAVAVQQNQRDDVLCVATGQRDAKATVDLGATLTCVHEQPFICKAVGVHQGQNGELNTSPTAYTLTTCGTASARNAPLVCENVHAFSLDGAESNSMKSKNPCSGCRKVETARTLDTSNPSPTKNQGGIAVVEVHPKVCGTLCASGAGLSRPGGMASEPDLCVVVPDNERCPAYCLQGNMIGREDHNGPRGDGVNEEISFTLTATDVAAVTATFNRQRSDSFGEENLASTQTARQCKDATDLVCQKNNSFIDCRNYREIGEISGALQAKSTGGYSLNFQNPLRSGYIVRRLLPVECERLQGYPDGWTEFGHDGKPISDTRRYQMLGNSVAVPCVAYILMGVAKQFGKEVFADGICTCTERPDESQDKAGI